MSAREEPKVWLFSYGTLRQPEVQLGTFGRLLEGAPDALPGHVTRLQRVTDPKVIALSGIADHPALVATGDAVDAVEGWAFALTEAEVAKADAYEAASNYRRVPVVLTSGLAAFVYVYGD